MNPSLKKYIGLGLLVIVAGGFWYTQSPTSGLPKSFRFDYPTNIELVYDVDARFYSDALLSSFSDSEASDGKLPEKSLMKGSIGLSGKLTLQGRGHQPNEGHQWVELGFRELDKIDVSLYGQDLQVPEKELRAFEAKKAYLLMASDGEIHELRFPDDVTLYEQQLIRPIALELQVLIQNQTASWERSQYRFVGLGKLRHDFINYDEELFELNRAPLALPVARIGGPDFRGVMPDLSGVSSIALHEDGYIQRIRVKEAVHLKKEPSFAKGEVSFDLKLYERRVIGSQNFQISRLESMTALQAQTIPGEALAQERALENRVGGLTIAQLSADILSFGASGKMPRHQAWVSRATALLVQNPEYAYTLEELYFHRGVGPKGQNLLMDILSSAGHDEAQDVMRTIWLDDRAVASENYFRIIQNATLLRHPNRETIDLLGKLATYSRNQVHRAAASASLGASIGKLYEQGKHDEAQTYNNQLIEQIESSVSPVQNRGLLYALGNTKLESNFDVIVPFLASKDLREREIATWALRHLKNERAQDTLRSMLSDQEVDVQETALRAMVARGMSEMDLQAVSNTLSSGRVGTELLPNIIRSLSSLVGTELEVQPIIASLRRLAAGNQELNRQINVLASQLAENSPSSL